MADYNFKNNISNINPNPAKRIKEHIESHIQVKLFLSREDASTINFNWSSN